jgi:soluble lytic murein transglycosylase-like protein
VLAASLAPAQADTGTHRCLRGQTSAQYCKQILSNYWRHEQTIAAVAKHYGLEPALLKALVAVESAFNDQARSPANARGLAKCFLRPHAAGPPGPRDESLQGRACLAAAAAYLRQMWFEFRDWQLALAAYNAGPGAVRKHKGIPPYKETQAYVPMVLGLYREFAQAEALAGH